MHIATVLLATFLLLSSLADAARVKKKACSSPEKKKATALLSTGRREPAKTALGTSGVAIFADGFSRAACDVDKSPATQRVNFKDHACGGVKTCALTETGMTPTICFDFCRQYEDAHFFGLVHGRDCYCTRYFDKGATGGQGECDLPCEGDSKELCGGMEKSSLFEMHLCLEGAQEMNAASEIALQAGADCVAQVEASKTELEKVRQLAGIWNLPGVCSKKPEGDRVCNLPASWLEKASEVAAAAAEVEHIAGIVVDTSSKLTEAENEKDENSVEHVRRVEDLTATLKKSAIKAKALASLLKSKRAQQAGPLGGKTLEAFEDHFEVLGNVAENWHSLCALEPIVGESWLAAAEDKPASCADRCLGLSTGVEACVAFNWQYHDGLAACQLLSGNGLIQPTIGKKVPIFEVSQTKVDAMGLASLDCYAKKMFMSSHPKGPLKTEVLHQVIVEAF